MKKLILAMVAVVVLTGCAKKFTITTEPAGADVTMNGEYLGKSPLEAKSACSTWGNRPRIQLAMNNFQPVTVQELQFEPSAGRIVADLFFFWPAVFLNANCPKDEYKFTLEAMKTP